MNDQQIGRLEADVAHLKLLTKENQHDIKKILALVNKAQGGIKIGLALATISGGIAGFLSKYFYGS